MFYQLTLAAASFSPATPFWDWGNRSRHTYMMSNGVAQIELHSTAGASVRASSISFNGVAFQGFDWGALSNRAAQYKNIESAAKELAASGIGAVWFPPPSKSVDAQGYMPGQWTELEGDSAQRSAVSAVSAAGIVPVADVVVNHRTAPAKDSCTNDYTAFAEPTMGDDAVLQNDYKCGTGVFCSGW